MFLTASELRRRDVLPQLVERLEREMLLPMRLSQTGVADLMELGVDMIDLAASLLPLPRCMTLWNETAKLRAERERQLYEEIKKYDKAFELVSAAYLAPLGLTSLDELAPDQMLSTWEVHRRSFLQRTITRRRAIEEAYRLKSAKIVADELRQWLKEDA